MPAWNASSACLTGQAPPCLGRPRRRGTFLRHSSSMRRRRSVWRRHRQVTPLRTPTCRGWSATLCTSRPLQMRRCGSRQRSAPTWIGPRALDCWMGTCQVLSLSLPRMAQTQRLPSARSAASGDDSWHKERTRNLPPALMPVSRAVPPTARRTMGSPQPVPLRFQLMALPGLLSTRGTPRDQRLAERGAAVPARSSGATST
mmetsp:Transcript_39486/g.113944  ORF Transcript_39486/g.113944 Transcript_39486/m.113944 type:complete len:201 (+) Transcript_39486:308-910(+)